MRVVHNGGQLIVLKNLNRNVLSNIYRDCRDGYVCKNVAVASGASGSTLRRRSTLECHEQSLSTVEGGTVRIVSVTVENFRSITAARRIPISNLTTLVGPNNEGKSNILRALVVAMTLLIARRDPQRRLRMSRFRRSYRRGVNSYDWPLDFPLTDCGKRACLTRL